MSFLERVDDDHAQVLFSFVWNATQSNGQTKDVIHEVFARHAKGPCLSQARRSMNARASSR
jgi:hypothetical protein